MPVAVEQSEFHAERDITPLKVGENLTKVIIACAYDRGRNQLNDLDAGGRARPWGAGLEQRHQVERHLVGELAGAADRVHAAEPDSRLDSALLGIRRMLQRHRGQEGGQGRNGRAAHERPAESPGQTGGGSKHRFPFRKI